MPDVAGLTLIGPFGLGLALSWLLEALLLPRPIAPWRRPMAALVLHVGVWTLAFALELALFRRPYFAVANVLAIELVIVLVSAAKYQALREPFVYPDFEYFVDAIRHPRLYLPFFGAWRAVIAGGAYGVALWAGLRFEQPMVALATPASAIGPSGSMARADIPLASFFMYTAVAAIAGALLATLAARALTVTFEAGADLRRLGLVSTLWAYARAERTAIEGVVGAKSFATRPNKLTCEPLPDLVSVQSESFFDVRREFPEVQRSVLAQFDELCAQAVQYGELTVAARGANTVRSEFAFLSGVDVGTLGVHQFNPYRTLASSGKTATLPSYLRALGYRTVCIHPYHANFYRRDRVLPFLGFDEFIHLDAFSDAFRCGPYVGDLALAECATRLFRERAGGQPFYIHIITMENHGPLHWETPAENERQEVLAQAIPMGCDDLVVYGKHLRNADTMFRQLAEALAKFGRPGSALCVYGDHIPIMSQVYKRMREPKGVSDYFIWRSGVTERGAREDMAIGRLAEAFARAAGVL